MQQQDQVTPTPAETLGNEETTVNRGPVPLAPEMLSWISGGVTPITDLPNATW